MDAPYCFGWEERHPGRKVCEKTGRRYKKEKSLHREKRSLTVYRDFRGI